MRYLMIFTAMLIAVEATVEAGPARRYRRSPTVSVTPRPVFVPTQQVMPTQQARPTQKEVPVVQAAATTTTANATTGSTTSASATTANGADDALDEVNAARARRGLRPFQPDPLLNQAARTCANIRAASRIAGHLSSDFAHLPPGASAKSAGCGALEPSWGWGTCCTYDNYTYAGAAWVMGADGKRYMHLFVR